MPTEDRFDDPLVSATPDERAQDAYFERLQDRYRSERRPNAFGCLLLITGILFALLFILGLRAYAQVAASDFVSLAMIGFVGILALGQLVVGVRMLRGTSSDRGLP